MKVTLVCVGQTRSPEINALCAEYEKRLSAFCEFETRFLRPRALPAKPSKAEICAALDAEADELMRHLEWKGPAYRVALCVEGRELTSAELSELIGERMQTYSRFFFVIGSSWGLSERAKQMCDLRLSLSRMTLPHELCRLIFSEQLYRAFAIQTNRAYHK